MTDLNKLTEEVERIVNAAWNDRDAAVIPTTESVALANGAAKITATFLYADLAGSSTLAKVCPAGVTAKIIRAYLDICSRIIKKYGGVIKSFDGDRVMGVFVGNSKNSNATKCAREIDYMVHYVLNEKAKEKFPSIKANNIRIGHCVGIDTGEVIAVRAGIRENSDLIWIGRAPSFAAKLSDIRKAPYEIYITNAVYTKLNTEAKFQSDGTTSLWEGDTVDYAGANHRVYKTLKTLVP